MTRRFVMLREPALAGAICSGLAWTRWAQPWSPRFEQAAALERGPS